MAKLYLDVPEDVDRKLRALAVDERRSVNAEAIVLLDRALAEVERERQDTP